MDIRTKFALAVELGNTTGAHAYRGRLFADRERLTRTLWEHARAARHAIENNDWHQMDKSHAAITMINLTVAVPVKLKNLINNVLAEIAAARNGG